jgi:hypothetical protein
MSAAPSAYVNRWPALVRTQLHMPLAAGPAFDAAQPRPIEGLCLPASMRSR